MRIKNFIYISVFTIFLFAICTNSFAQNRTLEHMISHAIMKEVAGDSLYVEISLAMDHISEIKSLEKNIISPKLTVGKNSYTFPSFVISGKGRQRLDYRNALLNKEPFPEQVEQYLYKGYIPFSPWMGDATLLLDGRFEKYAGCPVVDDSRIVPVNIELLPKVRYVMRPVSNLIMPEVEPIKNRAETGTTKINFLSGKSVIIPTYKGNSDELFKINNAIRKILDDTLATVNSVVLTAYSSPEGRYDSNERLSEARAQALKANIEANNDLKNIPVRIQIVAEDWNTLRKMVEESSYSWKEQVLKIIDSTDSYDMKERKLKSLNGGNPYRMMLNEWFPQLRRTDYQFNYSVKDFTVEQAREIIKTRPGQMSLNEMFHVANSYQKGADEFNYVFDVAVRLYPNNPIANINAAAVVLNSGDTKAAKVYLDRVGYDSRSYNNWAVYYMLLQDLKTAKEYLIKATDQKIEEIHTNINEIKLKEENDALFEKYEKK